MRVLLAAATALVAAGPAGASIWVADDPRSPALRVDARGYAEVSWRDTSGAHRTVLVPPRGRLLPGGRLAGTNVAQPSPSPGLPFVRVLLRTPDGRSWALQAWRPLPGGPIELHLSRWRGAPTELEATVTCCKFGDWQTIAGRASFQGRAVYGSTPTPEGKQVRSVVYVDAQRSGSWRRLSGVFPRAPRGTFSLGVPPARQGPRYRLTMAGPNLGATLAPDASIVVAAPA